MSVPSFSVKRPVFISMAASIVLILGGVALRSLPVDLMPDITYPAISISTSYEDASPEEVEQLITKPIEQAVSAVTGVDTVTSSSSEGASTVTIEFTWGTDLDEAASDVRDRLDRVIAKLPDDADRPVLRKFDSAAAPIMRMGIGTELDLLEARKFIDDRVIYRLERVDGVASAQLGGGMEREIHILFDHNKLRMLDISMDEVLSQIRNSNVTTPAGNLKQNRLEVRVRTPGVYSSLEEISSTVIAVRNGVPIRIGDVGEVTDTHNDITNFVRVNGKPGIFLSIFKQSGGNTVQVADGVLEEIAKINREMPMINIFPVRNEADYIKQSLSSVSDAAISGGILAVVVLLFFLRNIRSTLIIALSIPMSIVATFALIYFCGYTLNIMTLGGLALGIGMLVDNSIVVLENITRLRDLNLPPHEAAVKGTNEMFAAITASTLTTLAVFMPLVFVKGIAGVMFKQFSMVVFFSLVCSLVTAVTLVPCLAGLFLKKSSGKTVGGNGKPSLGERFFVASGRAFDRIESGYSAVLEDTLNHKLLVVTAAALLFAGSIFIAKNIGTEYMPKSDAGGIRATLEEAVGTAPEHVNLTVETMENDLRTLVPEMTGFVTSAGRSGWWATGGHKANFNIKLTSRNHRRRSNEEIALTLGKFFSKIPGAKIRWRAETGMMMGGGGNAEAIKVEIRGYEFDVADMLAARLAPAIEKVEGVTDVQISRDSGTPEQLLRIDRRKAGDLQISVRDIANAMRTFLAGTTAGTFRDGGDEYDILVKVRDADLLTVDQLLDLPIRAKTGEQVILRNLIQPEAASGAVVIERKNQERIVTLACNIAGRDLGSVAADVEKVINSIPIPSNFSVTISGDYEDQQEAFDELMTAFVLALVLVYMVMACQFESFRDPLVVMFSVPLAFIGVSVMLYLTNTTFNIQSFVGCIMLAGIVVNNAILLVSTANSLREEEKLELIPAVREAGRRRLRPILMTTSTTVLGLIPLALGWGDGGEIQAPLARAVIGGLTSSTFITLFLIPVVYVLAESMSLKKLLARRKPN